MREKAARWKEREINLSHTHTHTLMTGLRDWSEKECVLERVCVWERANTAVCISNSNSPVGGRGQVVGEKQERERERYITGLREGMCWRGGWQISWVSVFLSKLFVSS